LFNATTLAAAGKNEGSITDQGDIVGSDIREGSPLETRAGANSDEINLLKIPPAGGENLQSPQQKITFVILTN